MKSKVIWKYEIKIDDLQTHTMPLNAEILSVQMQQGAPYMWALVDQNAPFVRRQFALRCTGHTAMGLNKAQFIGTFPMHEDSPVFHLFDLGQIDDLEEEAK